MLYRNTVLLPLLFGALCLPFTYHLSRYGLFAASLAMVAVMGGLAGVLSAKAQVSLRASVLAFLSAAVLSELVMFSHYYLTYGLKDPKLGVGIGVALIEAVVIGLVGSVCLWVAYATAAKAVEK